MLIFEEKNSEIILDNFTYQEALAYIKGYIRGISTNKTNTIKFLGIKSSSDSISQNTYFVFNNGTFAYVSEKRTLYWIKDTVLSIP